MGIIGLFVGGLGAFVYEHTISKITGKEKLVIRKYKLHHSLYGILLVLIAVLLKTNSDTSVFLFSSGIGVIAEHYLIGGELDFVTKEK